MDSTIINQLNRIEEKLDLQHTLKKEVLNLNEACLYLELSPSHLYKLTSKGSIPYYKPNGKKLYFKRTELDSWLLRNRQDSAEEIETAAATYLMKKGRVKL